MLKYKTQWVVHGYKKEEKLDYIKIFVVIVKSRGDKCFFAIQAKHSYFIYYIDGVIAFLYNFLDKVIYMKQLYSFTIKFENIYKLIKILYKLKQASYVEYKTYDKFLK